MLTCTLRQSIPALLSIPLIAASAHAQPSHVSNWSLEARIAESEAVVIGPIAKVNRKVLVRPGEREKGGAIYPDGQHEQMPAIAVEEVIKGNLKGIVDDLHPRWSLSADLSYDQWMKAGNKMLWFLGSAPKPGQGRAWHMVAFGKEVPFEAFHGGRREPPMFAMDFTVLKSEQDILAHARKYAKTSKKIVPTDTIRYGPPWHDLVVPVEPALEPLATRLILSPRKFVPDGETLSPRDRYQFRYSGVRLLRHFKSDVNIDLLRWLLDDPLEEFESSMVMQIPVRVKAYEVLLIWGVQTRLPKDADKVTSLSLRNSDVSDAALKQVAQLKNLAHLELQVTKVTDKGLRNVAGLTKLRSIELAEDQRSDANLRALREIGLLHALSAATTKGDNRRPRSVEEVASLSLCRGPLTDAGLKEMAAFRNLEWLDLRDTRVSDAGLKELADLTKLTWLMLQGTQVTAAGVADLQKALPKCKINR